MGYVRHYLFRLPDGEPYRVAVRSHMEAIELYAKALWESILRQRAVVGMWDDKGRFHMLDEVGVRFIRMEDLDNQDFGDPHRNPR